MYSDRNLHKSDEMKAKNEVYVGPTTYRRFMEAFRYLYNEKSKERTMTVDKLKYVLISLTKNFIELQTR